jgi:3'5'-cyclic nucleotide phosphodiesterase
MYVLLAAFHNFQHANHVTMSVVKLMSRIVAPADVDINEFSNKSLHDHTYGITSDPLTRLAVVFSALIHDVDHQGVSNIQLIKEGLPIATYYKNTSVAEQNSIDMAWELLMDSNYQNLRRAIYTTSAEFKRFRSLVVNTVMATDIMDKDLKKLRNDRWEAAFDFEKDQVSPKAVNRKATVGS